MWGKNYWEITRKGLFSSSVRRQGRERPPCCACCRMNFPALRGAFHVQHACQELEKWMVRITILSPKEEFEEKIERGEFLEYAKVFNHYYGTLKSTVVQQQEKGRHVVLVIHTQGAMESKRRRFPLFIFLSLPPSLQELRERLFKRNTEHPERIEERLSWARHEWRWLSTTTTSLSMIIWQEPTRFAQYFYSRRT